LLGQAFVALGLTTSLKEINNVSPSTKAKKKVEVGRPVILISQKWKFLLLREIWWHII